MQESLDIKQVKIVKKLQSDVKGIRQGREKTAYMECLEKYEDEIMRGGKLKYNCASIVIDAITCPPLKINR